MNNSLKVPLVMTSQCMTGNEWMSIRPESKGGGGDEATGCWDDGHAERFCVSLSESVTWGLPSWRDSLGLYEEGLEKTRRWLISSVQSSVGGVAKAMTWGAGRAKTWRPEHLWERFTKKKAKAITKETWNNNILFVTRTLLLGSHIPFPTKRNRDS